MKWIRFIIILIASFTIPLIISIITWVKIIGYDLIRGQFSISSITMMILVLVGIYTLSTFGVVLIYYNSFIREIAKSSGKLAEEVKSHPVIKEVEVISSIPDHESIGQLKEMIRTIIQTLSELKKEIKSDKEEINYRKRSEESYIQSEFAQDVLDAKKNIVENEDYVETNPEKIYSLWWQNNSQKFYSLMAEIKSPDQIIENANSINFHDMEYGDFSKLKRSNIIKMSLENIYFASYFICFPIAGYPLKGFDRFFNHIEDQFVKKVKSPALIKLVDENIEEYDVIKKGEIK